MESLFLAIKRPGFFRSRAWLIAWVKAWADLPEINFSDKRSLVAMDTASLGGLHLESSFFTIKEPLFRFFFVLTAYPFGVSSKLAASIRSEYFQFHSDPFTSDPVTNATSCTNYFNDALAVKWDKFIFPDVLFDSAEYKSIIATARNKKMSVISSRQENTYGVNLKATTFADYLKQLGSNSRLKLFNSRKKLLKYGKVKVENIWPDRISFFNLLNAFHAQRWGKACYRDRNEIFINTLLDELPSTGAKVDFSVMTINGVAVSVAFDIAIDGRIYNLQSGYEENFARGLALGTLHLGYQIEAAFANKDIDYYDFMAGRGKNSDYKKSLSNSSATFITLTLVRSPLLRFAYAVKARMKNLTCRAVELGLFTVIEVIDAAC